MTQKCARCQEHKPQEAYAPGRWGRNGTYCRKCCSVIERERRARLGADVRKDKKLRGLYGINLEFFRAMSEAQGGKCAICGVEAELHVDHEHGTGRIRGLLCGKCNRGIGMFDDAPETLLAAASYLIQTSVDTETV